MKTFFSPAVKGAALVLTLCVGQAVQARVIVQEHTGAGRGEITWSGEEQARQLMSDEVVYDEDDIDVRTLPSRAPAIPASTSLIERVRTTGSTLASSTMQRVQEALDVNANSAFVMDGVTGDVLYGKQSDEVRSIASITKLMTAMVTVDARLDMAEQITLQPSDFVGPIRASSRLKVGDTMNRAEVLLMALMKSENPAAKSLARTYPAGYDAFIRAMNAKAKALGMTTAFFGDPTGLDQRNVASARDLARMVAAAYDYGVIRQFSTQQAYDFNLGDRVLHAKNTNALVRNGEWDIGLSKTGFINKAGRCVVMQARVNQHPAVIVLMGATTSQNRSGDATRILSWLQDRFSR
jgi:D-alanyl-D-alanine endopeptidase (penicillin-binding protein 7)